MYFIAAICLTLLTASEGANDIPEAWVDADTGHRVVRLSRREGSNSSFYFHQNPFAGDEMVFAGTTPEGRRLFAVDLKTLAIRQITDRDSTFEVVGPKRREVFYLSGGVVCATHLATKRTREIATIPDACRQGAGFSLNADETLLAASYGEGLEEFYKRPRSEWFTAIFEAHPPHTLYTIDVATGEIHTVHKENNWLGHIQFSPTDPTLLMFCHEGPWERLDRIWLIRTDGTGLRCLHQRTVDGEIAGHEFWGPKGKRVWFDLQVPMWKNFFLAGASAEGLPEIRYPLKPEQWSMHYNVSPDGSLFCGDGGARSAGSAGKWIYLYRPTTDGVEVERLCSLANHDYALEPNVRFTPDGQWVVFRSNMHGTSHVYAVEVAKSNK